MISHTTAYTTFKQQGIELYDFCVLLSFAIPCLNKEIAAVQGPILGKIPAPIYFRNSNMTAESLRDRIRTAGDIIGKELLISTFSYFEAYVIRAIAEVIAYHGGKQHLLKIFTDGVNEMDRSLTESAKKSKRKIQEYPKARLKAKYNKHNEILRKSRFCFPSQRLAGYGWKTLCDLIDQRRLNADKIPDILRLGLLFPMSDSDVSTFHTVGDKRNKIAHGSLTHYPARTAIEHGGWLRDLAVSLDNYLVENFLLIEVSAAEL
jgi:hypothetical protein